jgi:hypothetical protein
VNIYQSTQAAGQNARNQAVENVMRSVVCLITLFAIPGWSTASPAPVETPAIEYPADARLAAEQLAAAAAREAQKLRAADKVTMPAKSARPASAKAADNGGREAADRQLRRREAERLRVRDKYRELQSLRIAAARREQADNATADPADASHSD